MVYIRSKLVKGDKYLYLVKSVWDSKRSTSKQEIIKYLGKASQVKTEDIPIDYRDDPKITAFLSTHAGSNIKKTEVLIAKTREHLFTSMTKGDLDKSLDIYENYMKNANLNNFYEDILKPTMYHVGDLWEQNKLSVAAEHIASNIAKEMISIISDQNNRNGNKAKVLLCTPVGEEHSIGCQTIQSFLQSKGFRVFNLAPSAPTESILHFIQTEKPNIILVSITIEDNIRAGQRLVNKIKSDHNLPILVGGQAVFTGNYKFNGSTVCESSMDKIPKIIKENIKTSN